MNSHKPKAREFKHWVTSEVLPSILKTGGYMMVPQEETPEETMARALMIAQDSIKRREARLAELTTENTALAIQNQFLGETVETQKPKVEVYEKTMATDTLFGFSETTTAALALASAWS